MKNFLASAYAGAFEPDDVNLLIAAFEDAWTTVRASGIILDGNFESIRETLAGHIVRAAIAGERDPLRLRDAGLGSLRQAGTLPLET